MTGRDRKLLVSGFVFGVAIAVLAYGMREYLVVPKKVPDAPQPNVSTEQPQEPSSEAPVAIALTPDEQKSIGVETMEVKP